MSSRSSSSLSLYFFNAHTGHKFRSGRPINYSIRGLRFGPSGRTNKMRGEKRERGSKRDRWWEGGRNTCLVWLNKFWLTVKTADYRKEWSVIYSLMVTDFTACASRTSAVTHHCGLPFSLSLQQTVSGQKDIKVMFIPGHSQTTYSLQISQILQQVCYLNHPS